MGGQPKPGAEVSFFRKLAHIRANFRNNGLCQRKADPVYSDQVHACNPVEVPAHLHGLGRILAVRIWFLGKKRVGVMRLVPLRTDGRVSSFNFRITGFDLLSVKVVQGQGLLQHKEMFCSPSASQRFGNFSFVLFAMIVAQRCKLVRVALTLDNGSDDTLASLTHNIAEHLGELNVHVQECLLHVQNMGTAVLDQLRPVPQ